MEAGRDQLGPGAETDHVRRLSCRWVKLRLTALDALEAAGVAIRALPDLMQMLGRIAREVVLQLQPGPARPGPAYPRCRFLHVGTAPTASPC